MEAKARGGDEEQGQAAAYECPKSNGENFPAPENCARCNLGIMWTHPLYHSPHIVLLLEGR